MSDLRAVICVPVRNEAALLPDLIGALRCQDMPPGTFAAFFHLDSCTDASEAILSGAARHLSFPCWWASGRPGPPNAGTARRAACQAGLQQAPGAGSLLVTDADSRPATDWVRKNLGALRRADVVAGRIERGAPGAWPARRRQEAYLDRLHTLRRTLDPVAHDPLPSHPSLGGASLALRRSVYRALGGFEPFVSGEDAALVMRARREGWRVRHDPEVRVITSARLTGRAPGGLADELARLSADPEAFLVPDPDEAAALYRRQASLRRWFEALTLPGARAGMTDETGAALPALSRLAARAPTADAFVLMAGPREDRISPLSLTLAEARLSRLEQASRRACAA